MGNAFSLILIVLFGSVLPQRIAADTSIALTVPEVNDDVPSPGKRVLQSLPAYRNTSVRHSLYLPTDWLPNKKYPLIVEYAGNGRTVANGKPCLGYGISGGQNFD